jgi:hypothetical protein
VVFAHATGQSWEVVLKEYKVDVGYDPATFVAGETVRLDFNVTKEANGDQVEFGDVWVRVTKGEKTVFASGIHRPSIGRAGMTFTFPEAGDYTLSTRFEKDSTTIAETTFPMSVQQAEAAASAPKKNMQQVFLWITSSVAALSLVGCGVLLFRNKKS